jgi:hypothetical protein
MNSLTHVFSVDADGTLIVTMRGVVLKPLLCDSVFIEFGYTAGECTEVVLSTKPLPVSSGVPSTVASAPVTSGPFSFPSVPSTVSQIPSQSPSPVQSDIPSIYPSSTPVASPSLSPSDAPSAPSSAPEAPSSSPSEAPSAPSDAPSSAPSEAPSEAPSSIPSAAPSAAPTYSYATAIGVPGSSPFTINEGFGTNVDQTLMIDITAYDQYNNLFEGATFSITCDVPGPYAFSTSPSGPTQQSGSTNVNGNLRFYFTSQTVGTGFTITVTDQLSQTLPELIVNVLLVPDCSQLVTVDSLQPVNELVIGRDQPLLSYRVRDFFGLPVPGIVISFQETNPNPFTYTVISNTMPMPVTYAVTNEAPGNQSWQVSTGSNWCNTLTIPAFTWYWGVDCGASSVTLSSNTPLSTDGLTVTGVFVPIAGATLDNAQVTLSLGTNAIPIVLAGNTFSYTFSYDPTQSGPLYVSVELPAALGGCSIGGSGSAYSVAWTVPPNPPYCGDDSHSTVTLSVLTAGIGATVTVTIQARDAGGWAIADLPWSFISLTREDLPSNYSTSGTTAGDGTAIVYYTGATAGNDNIQVTFGSGDNSCTKQQTIFWMT